MQSKKEKPRISASKLNRFEMCGEAYKRFYIDGDKRLPGLNLVKGTAFHALAQKNNAQKIKTRIDIALADMQDYIRDQFEISYLDGINFTKEECTRKDQIRGETKDLLVATAITYRPTAETVMPRAVEQKSIIKMPNAKEDLVFIMDVETTADVIIDYKLTGKKKSQNDIDSDLGLTAYSMAFKVKHGKDPKSIAFHNFVSRITPKKKEIKSEFNYLETKRDNKDFSIFITRTENAIRAINYGIFTPPPVGAWKCSEKYCEYWGDCKYINYERKMAAEKVVT